jgi:uncharacterized alpha-E superfamily protein
MLSRVANSIYWMCRYIERAENVARFISVNLNLLLDMPAEGGKQWEPLVAITGDQKFFEEKYQEYSKEAVIDFLTFDRRYFNSIVRCLALARENARSIREIISSEMWEHLNNFYLEMADSRHHAMAFKDPHKFFKIIQMRSHLFTGLLDATMSHNEAWHFARLGMMLERADKTSRILDVKYFMLLPQVDMVNTPVDNIQWTAVLKSASAFEMFRKEHHLITPRLVAGFLILDKNFPRSIRYCVNNAQASLHRIMSGSTSGSGGGNPAEKLLGRLAADLEYTDIEDVVKEGMHQYLDSLQTRINQIDGAVGTTFFNITHLFKSKASQQQKGSLNP